MRIRIKFRRPAVPSVEAALFGDVFVPRQPRWRFLLASAAIHWLVLAVVPTLLQAWANTAHDEPDWTAYNAGPLIIQVPEPLHWPAARPHVQPAAEAKTQNDGRPKANQALRAQARASRGLELPVTQHISDQAPIVLQPDPVKLPAPSVPALPSMAFWTNAVQPPRRRAVIPGSLQHSQATPNLDAPPALSPSRPRLTASSVALNLPDAQRPPKLPLPNGSTNPVRLRGQASSELASFDMPLSEPVNLIYLMAHHPPARQAEIPHGLQNTPRGADTAAGLSPGQPAPTADRTAGALPADREQMARDAHNGSISPYPPGHAVDAQTPGADTHFSSDNAASRKAPAGKAAGTTAGATGRQASSLVTRAPGPPQESVIRVNHPSGGNFDVVILQSVSRDDLPDVGASLSGNPVYTVYLSVGDAREWLLEYCIPTNGGSPASSFQVNIDDQGTVAAPYPLSTVIPRNVFELPHPNHLVMHALLSTAGTLRAVETPNPESGLLREVLPLLSQWRFRPALRDRAPVEVEVLLIIPPRT